MSVQVGDITARCTGCGHTRFRRRIAKTNGAAGIVMTYRCMSCRSEVSRLDLVNQIGDEATRRARSTLSAMRERAARRKKAP